MFFGTVSSYNPKTGWFLILYEDGDSEEVNLKELKKILYKIFKFKGGAEKSLLAQKNAKIKADKIAAQSLARIQRAGKFDALHTDLRVVFSAFADRGPHLARINA